MAFRRRRSRPFRRSFRRRGGFSRSRFARKKYDLVGLLDTFQTCSPNTILGCNQGDEDQPCGNDGPGCCFTTLSIPVYKNTQLQGVGGTPPVNLQTLSPGLADNIRIVRLMGDIWIRDVVNYEGWIDNCTAEGSNTPLKNYLENYAFKIRLGLHRAYVSQATVESPFDDASTPLASPDWTEARWLWLRDLYWEPHPSFEETREAPGGIVGVCSRVTGGGGGLLVNSLVSGTGTINTAIDDNTTSCDIITSPDEGACVRQLRTFHVNPPPLLHWRFNLGIAAKRGLRLRADEQLNLQVGWSHPPSTLQQDGSGQGWGCGCVTDPSNGRCFEQSNIKVHAQIRAIMQQN